MRAVVSKSQRLLGVHIRGVMRGKEVSGRDRRGSVEPSEPFKVCMRSKQRYLLPAEQCVAFVRLLWIDRNALL